MSKILTATPVSRTVPTRTPGFEADDLREGEEVLSDTWAALTDEPLPDRYDFRMRPARP
ncbi:hypothetical protein GCM10009863_46940 [Streptomyces axinellae]|uniref:Uncharacterized protein n=1 Tax=Streptomyces axinellae TaxID=552788 RepID=A0ABP6CV66_9ACTN